MKSIRECSSSDSSTVRRVLLVDDDVSVLNVLRIGLRVEGFEVAMATNGREALEILAGEAVDVVVADLMMPVMDGRSFLRALREELALDVPVVILTGVDREEVAAELEACGARAVLHKPLRVDEVAEVLERVARSVAHERRDD